LHCNACLSIAVYSSKTRFISSQSRETGLSSL
jgi:hypothetical protein